MSECLSVDPETGVQCMLTDAPHDQHVAHIRWADEPPAPLPGPVTDLSDLTIGEIRAGVARCPECLTGKHGNCDGGTWSWTNDCEVPCPCPCRRVNAEVTGE